MARAENPTMKLLSGGDLRNWEVMMYPVSGGLTPSRQHLMMWCLNFR